MSAIIQTQDLRFSYPAAEGMSPVVLDGVSLEIEEGSLVAVLGHNGSGKSTLAKHMNAILLPSGGTVYVDGIPQDEPYINEPMLMPSSDKERGNYWEVPEGSVFVMGDNRNASADSRNMDLGTVDTRYIIGRAVCVLLPFQDFRVLD